MHWFRLDCRPSGDGRTVQELFGHKDVATTETYTQVLDRDGMGIRPGRPLPGMTMRSPFFTVTPVPSLPRTRDTATAQSSRRVRQVRLTPSIARRAVRGISCNHGTLRRSRGRFEPQLGRPPCRVHGIYAGLSNKRWADGNEHAYQGW